MLAQLKTDITPEDDALGVTVSTVAGFNEGDVVHVGREAIQVTAVIPATSRLSFGSAVCLAPGGRLTGLTPSQGSSHPSLSQPCIGEAGVPPCTSAL